MPCAAAHSRRAQGLHFFCPAMTPAASVLFPCEARTRAPDGARALQPTAPSAQAIAIARCRRTCLRSRQALPGPRVCNPGRRARLGTARTGTLSHLWVSVTAPRGARTRSHKPALELRSRDRGLSTRHSVATALCKSSREDPSAKIRQRRSGPRSSPYSKPPRSR
jgi:hypothetical protein